MKRCFCKAGVFLIFVFTSLSIYAQENIPGAGAGIEVNAIVGRVFKHTTKFHLPLPDHTSALDINYTQQTDGRKEWQQRRHYPVVGFGITYTDYGNDVVYGKCIGIYPQLQASIIKGKHLEWNLRMGMGVGYVSRHYDAYNGDTLNNAIGSHLNNFTLFATHFRYHINAHWDVNAGVILTHISNASARQPNLGINMYAANIGVRYYPVSAQPKRIVHDLELLKNRWLAQFRLGFALTENNAPNGPIYPVYLASVFASKRYASRNKAFAGVDYSFHEGIYAFLRNNEIYKGSEKENSYKLAVFAGNEFLMGHIGIVLQAGYYLKEPYAGEDKYYEKLGMNVYLIKHESGFMKELTIGAFLKAHAFTAELGEFGVGMGF